MTGRIAVSDMTPVARGHFSLSFTHVARLAGSPAWAVSTAPSLLLAGATRRAAAESTGGTHRLDLPITVT